MENAIKADPSAAKLNLAAKVSFPRKENTESPNAGFWITMTIVFIIVMFWIIGIVVQFTTLGDIEGDQNNKSKFALFFYSFNPIVNFQKLFTVRAGGEQRLNVLNGVRVLSICWVIAGHTFGFMAMTPILNSPTMQNIYSKTLFSVIPGGMYAVDSFFYLSGFLSCYLLTTKMYPKKGKISVPLLYFHRYYRLIFPIVFCTLIMMYIMKYAGDGPVYK